MTQKELVTKFYRAFSEHKAQLFDQVLSETWEDIPLAPDQGPGPEGIKTILKGLLKALPDLRMEVQELIIVPGKAATRVSLTGTHQGALLGIPASGKSVEIRFHEFHELEGDRIVRTWHVEDWLGFLVQVGAWPR